MDGLRILRGVIPTPVAGGGGLDARSNHPVRVVAAAPSGGAAVEACSTRGSYMSPQPRPFRKLWPEGDGAVVEKKREGVVVQEAEAIADRPRGNWVMNIMRVQSLWGEERGGGAGVEEEEMGGRCGECDGSEGCVVEEEAEAVAFGRDSFSKLLRRATLVEMQLYAKLSYLSNLAYTIPKIKAANLLKYHGLRLVTSSLEKKAKSVSGGKEQSSLQDQDQEEEEVSGAEENERQRENSNGMNTMAAYQIAASAASYLLSRTRGILPFGSANSEIGRDSPEGGNMRGGGCEISTSEMASFVATTNSVTAVVAAKEEMKQAVVDDLNSLHSSPCEWFVCDDASSSSSSTRFFVIQGSESLASWQANLLFEPVQFEGLDVLVHRGIYEAAKGIYQQMLPEIQAHLKSRGSAATLRFTGHSLGGSLALLVNLMLLIREEAPASSLLPVVTFGAPTIMCGGDYLLQKLGLPQSHVQAITMHRDIVPRAFSCNYPDHVAKILTTVNGNFRNHPCLKNQKLLYAPMGKLLILQPEEKFSPHHHLLPSGSGLYLLGHSLADSHESVKLLQAALSAFLNSPHPLEILSDRAAYGSDGTVYRDHDMSAYLRSVQGVIRQELRQIRKAEREQRRLFWWPVLSAKDGQSDITSGRRPRLTNSTPHMFSFAGAFHGGKETLKRFGSMVASQHVHLIIVLMLPARLLLMGAVSFVSFR